jgi:hypothetical protein
MYIISVASLINIGVRWDAIGGQFLCNQIKFNSLK